MNGGGNHLLLLFCKSVYRFMYIYIKKSAYLLESVRQPTVAGNSDFFYGDKNFNLLDRYMSLKLLSI